MIRSRIVYLFPLFFALACENGGEDRKIMTSGSPYLNHSDSARYVGMNTCRQCHQGIYETFINTGMGRSIGLATREKSSADFSRPDVYDPRLDLHYTAFWRHDSLYMREFRLAKNDTVFRRDEKVSFIIGSGQHTNSHLQSQNGYVHQMPMTYYTQKKKWDLPPGFENGFNTRFSRKIGLECMSCHNSFPEMVLGSENKYRSVPLGIGCERCHGPGSLHVQQRLSAPPVDTSVQIDYSIVNPGKLSAERQFDVCQRCHLQGNAVLKEGSDFFSFRPGMRLSDHMTVFLPKYDNSDEEFIMASHADRLKMSPCFIASQHITKKDELRPSRGGMTCVTCHNPHISVRETNPEVFNQACLSCHKELAGQTALAEAHPAVKQNSLADCVRCHMPSSGSIDIPHVSVHDHYIRKPVAKKEQTAIRKFLALHAVNESSPAPAVKATAYLNQYEKFDQSPFLLDSAESILVTLPAGWLKYELYNRLWYFRRDFQSIDRWVNETGAARVLDSLSQKSYDNRHAWFAYRIAEALSETGKATQALDFFRRAVVLAPYQLDFRNKYATALAAAGKLSESEKEFSYILSENPAFVPAYSNFGYVRLMQGYAAEARRIYQQGLALDPDNPSLLLNLAGYCMYMKDVSGAKNIIRSILKKDPANVKARRILKQLES